MTQNGVGAVMYLPSAGVPGRSGLPLSCPPHNPLLFLMRQGLWTEAQQSFQAAFHDVFVASSL